jgi:hypothetical protein
MEAARQYRRPANRSQRTRLDSDAVHLEAIGLPDALHRAQADPDGAGHHPTGQWVAAFGRFPHGSASTRAMVAGGNCALPGLRVLSRSNLLPVPASANRDPSVSICARFIQDLSEDEFGPEN